MMTHKETEGKSMMLIGAKDQLLEAFKAKLSEGIAAMDAEEAGEVVDMIKDLAEADKACWEACYYKSIVEAMEKADEESERMGYDNWRYSSGRFAPTGRGTRSGYGDGLMIPPYMTEDGADFWDGMSDGMMGYTQGGSRSGSSGGGSRGGSRSTGGGSNASGYSNGGGSNGGYMGYTSGDPIDTLAQLWQQADEGDRRKMKQALEEMAHSLGE